MKMRLKRAIQLVAILGSTIAVAQEEEGNQTMGSTFRPTPLHLADANRTHKVGLTPITITFAPSEVYEYEIKKLIDNAQTSIDLAVFSLDDPSILKALRLASQRGVKVRVCVNKPPDHATNPPPKAVKELIVNGLLKLTTGKNGFMHYKFMVVDKKIVWHSSGNLTRSSFYFDDCAITIRNQEVAEAFSKEFEFLWHQDQPHPTSRTDSLKLELGANKLIEIFFSPKMPIKQRILKEINNARSEITILACIISDQDIAQALLERQSKGIRLNIIVEASQAQEHKHSQVPMLRKEGLEVQYGTTRSMMHHKIISIDGKRNLFLTANLSEQGLHESKETMIIIDSPELSKEINKEFKRCVKSPSYEFSKWNETF